MFKRIVSLSVSVMLCFVLLSCANNSGKLSNDNRYVSVQTESASAETNLETEKESKVKTLDIYIIAGQSNAAGYTKINEDTLKTLWSQYKTGSSSVLYSGKAEYTNNSGTPNVSTGVNAVSFWVNAKAGQGRGKDYMGPELGMAKILSEEYYDGVNKTAGILKFAHGGTSLLNKVDGENAASGNWVSPSYAEYLGIQYEGLTGGLYRSLLTQVRDGIARLGGKGYEDINIKGLFWMQGESDRSQPNEYSIAFKYFVEDIRRDLGNLMNEDLSKMAVMIGEISETAASASQSSVLANKSFIAMQRKLAEEIDNAYIIASSQYRINEWVNGADVKDLYQNDVWHWNTEKMFAVGELVGRCVIDKILI